MPLFASAKVGILLHQILNIYALVLRHFGLKETNNSSRGFFPIAFSSIEHICMHFLVFILMFLGLLIGVGEAFGL